MRKGTARGDSKAMRWGLLFIALTLGACAHPIVAMVNPSTGEWHTCTSHLPPGARDIDVGWCTRKLRSSGFVKAEELTAEQRAALQGEPRRNKENASATGEAQSGTWRRVTGVLDAQTIVLDGGQTLRYLGIRPVEGAQSPRAVTVFGEAVAFNRQFVEGQTVRLEFDERVHDPEGRLWAYVYLSDGRMVNALLVEQGYAQADPYQGYLKHSALFQQLEVAARTVGRGYWAR